MKVVIAALALALSACTTVVSHKYDEEFLTLCTNPPKLEGLTGEDVVKWAEKAGPLITECTRVHNGLVNIIKSSE